MSWKVGVLSAVLLTVLGGVAYVVKQNDVAFDRLQEAQAALAARGFYCTSDTANGQVGCGFLISRTAMKWNEVGMLCKTGPMGPEWDGKVWVTLNPDFWRLEVLPEQAGVRVWGAVVAYGDEEFLKEIDEAL